MGENQFVVPAWAISLVLHGVVLGLSFAFSAQIKPLVQENLFSWDVAFVQQATGVSQAEPTESIAASVKPVVKKALPAWPRSVPEPSQPITPTEQNIETPPPTIVQQSAVPQVRQEPSEQRVVEVTESKTQPVLETKESVASTTSSEPGESQLPQPEPAVNAAVPALPSEAPISQENTVSAVAMSGSETRTDNRWLAESLWRRVAELKRYPSVARLNGQEGKVILKAVIRSDGQLADVVVQKSSGHSVLDEAAIEAVKLACPLHMKQAIGKPQIVVSLPIVYSLAN
ncbi:MAG TPA: energy transducer TonB [Nitrospira sp.]|nr:energy transducer TonB [Nitrospira sp.]